MKVKSYTAAASDAHMGGLDFPAMSCATSGNVGITGMLPLVVMAEELGVREKMLRGIALSYLLTILMKPNRADSRLSACAAGRNRCSRRCIPMLPGRNADCADRAIQNIAGSLTGIVCDGAKYGISARRQEWR
ncbi:hypothetical protein MASR2M79_15760 [Aminivibrio sp.]